MVASSLTMFNVGDVCFWNPDPIYGNLLGPADVYATIISIEHVPRSARKGAGHCQWLTVRTSDGQRHVVSGVLLAPPVLGRVDASLRVIYETGSVVSRRRAKRLMNKLSRARRQIVRILPSW